MKRRAQRRDVPGPAIHSLLRHQRGVVGLTTALLAPALIGTSALVVDIGVSYSEAAAIGSGSQAASMAAARAAVYGVTSAAGVNRIAATAADQAGAPKSASVSIVRTGSSVTATVSTSSGLPMPVLSVGRIVTIGARTAARAVTSMAGGIIVAPRLPPSIE